MTKDDRQLLIGIARGRDDCARELWSRFAKALIAQARAIVGESAASDIVQNALCRILQLPISKLRNVDDVGAWLATLIHNEAANHLRSERRREFRERTRGKRERSPEIATSNAFGREHAILWAKVDTLPRRMREVIVLKLVAGLTFDQIAIALGQNRNTAAARFRGALEMIRNSDRPADNPVFAVGVTDAQ